MKIIHKALLIIGLIFVLSAAVSLIIALMGHPARALGYAFGSGIVIFFSLLWVLSINRICMTDVFCFLKRFAIIFLLKFIVLITTMLFSLSVLGSDRMAFVAGFIATSLFAIPLEIWFGLLQRGKTNAAP